MEFYCLILSAQRSTKPSLIVSKQLIKYQHLKYMAVKAIKTNRKLNLNIKIDHILLSTFPKTKLK